MGNWICPRIRQDDSDAVAWEEEGYYHAWEQQDWEQDDHQEQWQVKEPEGIPVRYTWRDTPSPYICPKCSAKWERM